MSRFNTNAFRSLNESIARVQNPQAALDEAMEYTALLEEVLLSLCEELGLDPDALLEDVQTFERKRETQAETRRLQRQRDAADTRTAAGDKQERSASAKLRHRYKRDMKELASKQLYAKGGKVVRKGTKKYNREMERSKKQTAAHEKATQKKFDAEQARRRRNNPNWKLEDRASGGGYGNVASYLKATTPKGPDPNKGYAGWW
jgi:hypothetical protein